MSEGREAFEAWYESEKMKYWLMCADKEMCFGIWQAALEWQAARQSAGATCPHGVDDGACKQCYAEAARQEPVGTLSIHRFRKIDSMVNHDFEYYGSLPDGTYRIYAAPIGDNGTAQPAESKRVELSEGQVIEAIQKACGEYRHGCSYSFEDAWNCIEAALLARAQAKGE